MIEMLCNNKIKILIIIVLVLAITGMTLGFAAFSSTLNISSSAIVTPNSDDFKVVISGSDTDFSVSEIGYVAENGATADVGFCNGFECNSSNVQFTEPGQKVTYKAYVHNIGKYVAYIKTIEFANVNGTEHKKICSAVENGGATQTLVDAACEGIRVYCQSPAGYYYDNMTFLNNNNILNVGDFLPVYTIIEYQEGAARVDGPFNVQFGDVKLVIKSSNA